MSPNVFSNISVYMCVHVCAFVRAYVCACVCVRVCVSSGMYVCGQTDIQTSNMSVQDIKNIEVSNSYNKI